MTWLLTGGAGYIGSHIVRAFVESGRDVVVVDDLSSGFREFVPDNVELVETSILDTDLLEKAMRTHDVAGVVHLAGRKYAGVSVQQPLDFYRNNVAGTLSVLEAMSAAGVNRLVFSSSAAVYGTPDEDVVTEATPTSPESPYGETKLAGEWLARDVARIGDLRHTSLRYFNVVGSGPLELYDASPHNLFPLLLRALEAGREPKVFGSDYPTRDGTAERDYVHVMDVAEAHVTAALRLEEGELADVYNIGTGQGVTVAEIMDAFRRVTGDDFAVEMAPRRPGDPARIVASSAAIERDLQWHASRDLDDMVRSAWESWQHRAG
jgi:UDP-glucose 4-epimerase